RRRARWRMSPDRILVRVDGRELELSNLDKVMYPAAGFTKGEVIDYYTRVAPVLLPHLEDRALTRVRYPNGVAAPGFFEKNAADGLDAHPKISGKKGMQLVCPIAGVQSSDEVSAYAHRIAEELERANPRRIVSRMAKRLRPGRVFIDWSQNSAAKTTVTQYSL